MFAKSLTLSWPRCLLFRYQSIDLLCKSMDWFLYDRDLRHERVKELYHTSENSSSCIDLIFTSQLKLGFTLRCIRIMIIEFLCKVSYSSTLSSIIRKTDFLIWKSFDFRAVFRTESNIYDGAFLQLYLQKRSIINLWLGCKYVSGLVCSIFTGQL